MSTPTMEHTPVEVVPAGEERIGDLTTGREARRVGGFRTWHWALVPALAFLAYVTVLRVGFLADDLVLLAGARRGDWAVELLPRPDWFLYRPVGTLFTWILGWQLWGYNPLPYHLEGLLIHAGGALALGLWAAAATTRRPLGLLAGSLFAIYPLNTEAVGWLAAQWDALAALFGLLALWLFTRWWRSEAGWGAFALAVLLYGLGIYTKESLLAFLPLFALSVWVATPRFDRPALVRLVYGLMPFVLVLASNVALRFAAWGTVGGYPGAPTNFLDFLWSGLAAYVGVLLAPVSAVLLGGVTVQLTGAVTTVLLLLGLIWYGREHRRLLTTAVAWVLLAVVPVANLPINAGDLGNNRLLYLGSAGYCVLLAALLYSAVVHAGRLRLPVLSAVGLLFALSAGVTWIHLRPWHTATVQAADLEAELRRVIPAEPRPKGMVWYAEGSPHVYKGAQVLGLGLGLARTLSGEDWPAAEGVERADAVDLSKEHRDAFAMRIFYSQSADRFFTNYVSGMTWDSDPPTPQEAGEGFQVWDFGTCSPEAIAAWQALEARPVCELGRGLILRDPGADQQLVGPTVQVDPGAVGARYLRLRVAVRYPSNQGGPGLLSEWFWKGPGQEWSGERARTMKIKQDGNTHVYWTFLPTFSLDGPITGLRFDPANGQVASAVRWIAVDMVK